MYTWIYVHVQYIHKHETLCFPISASVIYHNFLTNKETSSNYCYHFISLTFQKNLLLCIDFSFGIICCCKIEKNKQNKKNTQVL